MKRGLRYSLSGARALNVDIEHSHLPQSRPSTTHPSEGQHVVKTVNVVDFQVLAGGLQRTPPPPQLLRRKLFRMRHSPFLTMSVDSTRMP